MATALLSRVALQPRTGDDGRAQQDGHRAEQAVARQSLGQVANVANGVEDAQFAALGRRGAVRAGEGAARERRVDETRAPMRAGAAAVTEITAAASCIRGSAMEGA